MVLFRRKYGRYGNFVKMSVWCLELFSNFKTFPKNQTKIDKLIGKEKVKSLRQILFIYEELFSNFKTLSKSK